MKKTIVSVKKFVSTHKTALVFVAGVATAAIIDTKLHGVAAKQWNDFLDEKGLKDEFYSQED